MSALASKTNIVCGINTNVGIQFLQEMEQQRDFVVFRNKEKNQGKIYGKMISI